MEFANWINLGHMESFLKFYALLDQKVPDRELKVHLKIKNKDNAKLAGLCEIVVVSEGVVGQQYPILPLCSLMGAFLCFLFMERGKKLELYYAGDNDA